MSNFETLDKDKDSLMEDELIYADDESFVQDETLNANLFEFYKDKTELIHLLDVFSVPVYRNRNRIFEILGKYLSDRKKFHELCIEIYKKEVKDDICIYSVSAPIHKMANYILRERLANYEEYLKLNKELLSQENSNYSNYLTNLGIDENVKLIELLKKISSTKKDTFSKITYDDKTILGLLRCKKHLLAPSFISENKGVQTTLFIGEYNNQTIIFEEKIVKKIKYTRPTTVFDENNADYCFGFYVNGDPKHFVILIRADYKPNRTHFNKTNKLFGGNIELDNPQDYDVNSPNFDEYAVNPTVKDVSTNYYEQNLHNGNPIAYSHIHLLNERYSVLAPMYDKGIDCISLSNNKIYDYTPSDCEKYLSKHPIRSFEDIEDYCGKYSIEQLDNFNKFVYFLRTITQVDVPENKRLLISSRDFIPATTNPIINVDITKEKFAGINLSVLEQYELYKENCLEEYTDSLN